MSYLMGLKLLILNFLIHVGERALMLKKCLWVITKVKREEKEKKMSATE
jgi:hypothetical protein